MKLALVPGALLLAAALPASAAPPSWTPVQSASSIGFSGTHAGNAFKGTFGQWRASIRFDPADLAHSKAAVVIATASAKTGDKFQETSLGQAEWFNPAKFPQASFVTTKISPAGAGRYVADGTLTIKGKALPVKLPFALKINGDTATLQGETKVDRIAYDIGAKSDPSGAWVSRQITISINMTAKRAK
ncbi:MAG TPA: YceI family protein [Sphingomonadaceae bacterium]|nr:YceI family protein [Sphingomonadaceae bacterium]